MFTNNTVLTSKTKFFLSSYARIFGDGTSESAFVKIDGDHLTATGTLSDRPLVQFYVERTEVGHLPAFRFKSVEAPHKYVAVSGGNIVLKNENEIADDRRTFLVHEIDNDFMKFQAVSTNMFLSADKDGKVFLATETVSNEREAWFRVFSITEVENIVAEEVEFVSFNSIPDKSSNTVTNEE